MSHSFVAGIALLVPATVVVGRTLRALEVLVHEASHSNLFTKANDKIADAFAAVPSFQLVSQYRKSHLREHHGGFGSERDPCLNRYLTEDLRNIPRHNLGALAQSLLVRFIPYTVEWYRTIGTRPSALVLGGAWYASYLLAFGAVLGVRATAMAASVLGLAFAVVLPVIRLLGEADEHDYSQPTEFAATFTSLGRWQRLLAHPHGDGFHAEHHRFPKTPHHRLRSLRRELLLVDPTWQNTPTHQRLLRKDKTDD